MPPDSDADRAGMGRRASDGPAARPARRKLRVLVVDPMPVFRAGLRLLIDDAPDLEVLADVGSADETLEVIAGVRGRPIVVLVGLGVDGERDAYWLIRALRERYPAHALLALGANANPVIVSRALFMGADGFVDKTADPAEFLEAIRRVATGDTVLSVPPTVALGEVAAGLERRREIDGRLTNRERQVLVVAAEGLTARQIADRLGVRERTVTTHLARIYGKLGVGNRLSAISVAARSGLVSVGAFD